MVDADSDRGHRTECAGRGVEKREAPHLGDRLSVETVDFPPPNVDVGVVFRVVVPTTVSGFAFMASAKEYRRFERCLDRGLAGEVDAEVTYLARVYHGGHFDLRDDGPCRNGAQVPKKAEGRRAPLVDRPRAAGRLDHFKILGGGRTTFAGRWAHFVNAATFGSCNHDEARDTAGLAGRAGLHRLRSDISHRTHEEEKREKYRR